MRGSSRKGVFGMAGTGVVLLVLALFWPDPKPQNPFILGMGVWPGMETLILARESGALSERDVNFVGVSWTSATIMAFKNRVVDGAVVTLDEVIRLKAGGHHPKVVLVFGDSNGSDALVVRPEFSSLKDLRGRRIGVEFRSSGEYLLARALRRAGMNLSDVVRVPINLAEAESAYEQNELDAVVTSDPVLTRLLEKGAQVLFDSSQIPGTMSRVLVIREDLLDDPPKGLREIVGSHFDYLSRLYTPESDKSGMAAVLRREALNQTQLTKSLRTIKGFSREENMELLSTGAEGLEPILKEMALFMKWEKLLEQEENVEGLLDARLVKGGGR